jgi:hypothetical protein
MSAPGEFEEWFALYCAFRNYGDQWVDEIREDMWYAFDAGNLHSRERR